MASRGFIIRPAENVEEVSALWWPLISKLGWNRDADDAITHFRVANNGKDWLLLIPEDSSKPEGTIVAFKYANGTGWVGFFIVNAPFRGNGLGRELYKELERSFRASNTTVVGLDGVEEQVNTYKRRGFQDIARIPLMTRSSLKQNPLSTAQSQRVGVEGDLLDIRSVDPKILAKIDLDLTGLDRTAYWSHDGLLARCDAFGYALSSGPTSTSPLITGFILVRRCEHGHRFGPLYADTYYAALRLLFVAMNRVAESDGSLIAEVFGSNSDGRKVFEELGWTWAGLDYHRMWLDGRVPAEQQPGGKGTKNMFAIFDASSG
ncbi:hypothetical protein K458DRAFT_412881 [Lentithecium fluviatile CBS 122367]|uniref:N-acetyltransferase domain-containing protein n=1 Tax=Lentithecium fluviatile CBS 122367 TaxID=1168545 RepID=A0A6G1JHK9_9PLEO|nr:hypothetical protein K458DRAFT_412881 [Lentithecium fluviatile CBS 122367]